MASETTAIREPRFCQQCGEKLSSIRPLQKYTCSNGHSIYLNPIPVVVAILPVEGGGIIQVRRSIEPGAGKLAFPGGNASIVGPIEAEVSREVAEETGIETEPCLWRAHHIESATGFGKTLLFFRYGIALPVNFNGVADAREVSEIVVVSQMPNEEEMAFPIHAQVLRGILERTD